jgi:hypothetical protein
MRSASVSYQFPSQIAKAIGMTNCRVFVQGQNLFTWSKNKYILDTETQVQGGPLVWEQEQSGKYCLHSEPSC